MRGLPFGRVHQSFQRNQPKKEFQGFLRPINNLEQYELAA
jgi:hypothetical protein